MSTSPSKKVVPNRLPPEVFEALKAVVGERWISQQRSVIETYSKFSIDGQSFLRKYAKDPHAIPACIILPSSTEEVQAIVKLCNTYRVPFLPFTNGQVFCNVTTPAPTLCIHLSRMNRVLAIDEDTQGLTHVPDDGIRLLWRGQARHGVSARNTKTGRFRMTVDGKIMYVLSPEGATTEGTTVIYRLDLEKGQWSHLVYPNALLRSSMTRMGRCSPERMTGTSWSLSTERGTPTPSSPR